jgi:hypothetical protein
LSYRIVAIEQTNNVRLKEGKEGRERQEGWIGTIYVLEWFFDVVLQEIGSSSKGLTQDSPNNGNIKRNLS